MKLLRKLNNPFALMAQGFVAGALIFLSGHPETGESIAAAIAGTAASVNGAAEAL